MTRNSMRTLWKVLTAFCVSVFLIIAYYRSVYGNPSMSVEVTGQAERLLDEPVTYTIMVSNTGDRNLLNVVIVDSYGFEWSGSLAVGESRTFSCEFNGPIRDEVVNEVRAEGYTEKGLHVWSSDSWTLVTIGGNYTLTNAINEGLIDVELRGTGYCSGSSIKLKIVPKLEISINIEIKPGWILRNSGSGQNMIIAETRTVIIEPEIELDLDIESYCLDLYRDNPSIEETFSIETDPKDYEEDVVRLMESLTDLPPSQKPISAVQIALWVITEDISLEDIRIEYSPEDIEAAKWLLENADINIKGKRLFPELIGGSDQIDIRSIYVVKSGDEYEVHISYINSGESSATIDSIYMNDIPVLSYTPKPVLGSDFGVLPSLCENGVIKEGTISFLNGTVEPSGNILSQGTTLTVTLHTTNGNEYPASVTLP